MFAILLVAASTMAMAVRERTRELACLRLLGFQRGALLVMVVVEGMLVSLGGRRAGHWRAHGCSCRAQSGFWRSWRVGRVLTVLSIIGILSGVLLPEHHPRAFGRAPIRPAPGLDLAFRPLGFRARARSLAALWRDYLFAPANVVSIQFWLFPGHERHDPTLCFLAR